MNSNAGTIILVTGGSRLTSLHCTAQAIAAGYQVRTTIGSESKKQNALASLMNAQPHVDASKVEYVIADLLKDEGWAEAVKDVFLECRLAATWCTT